MERIDYGAFSKCSHLTNVALAKSVTNIGPHVFEECVSLTSIVLPDGMTTIGDSVFLSCSALKSVTIPSSVTKIDSYAFNKCSSLTDVYYAGTKEQWNNISIRSYNTPLTSASIHCTGTTSENSITTGTASTSDSKFQATFANAKAGKEYVVLVSRSGSDPLNADNLIYINQITADAFNV